MSLKSVLAGKGLGLSRRFVNKLKSLQAKNYNGLIYHYSIPLNQPDRIIRHKYPARKLKYYTLEGEPI